MVREEISEKEYSFTDFKSELFPICRVGAHYRSGNTGDEQDFQVERIINHESYKRPRGMAHDISLLKLRQPAQLNGKVGLACLPGSSGEVSEGKTCWVTGDTIHSANSIALISYSCGRRSACSREPLFPISNVYTLTKLLKPRHIHCIFVYIHFIFFVHCYLSFFTQILLVIFGFPLIYSCKFGLTLLRGGSMICKPCIIFFHVVPFRIWYTLLGW